MKMFLDAISIHTSIQIKLVLDSNFSYLCLVGETMLGVNGGYMNCTIQKKLLTLDMSLSSMVLVVKVQV